jgi:hypothetical protein
MVSAHRLPLVKSPHTIVLSSVKNARLFAHSMGHSRTVGRVGIGHCRLALYRQRWTVQRGLHRCCARGHGLVRLCHHGVLVRMHHAALYLLTYCVSLLLLLRANQAWWRRKNRLLDETTASHIFYCCLFFSLVCFL